MGRNVLQIDDVHKSYPTAEGAVAVLTGVSLALAAGESVALTGESGSGKSTLLHLAGGLDRPDRGEVTVAGVALSGLEDAGLARVRRDRIGIVFQQFNLIPSLTVAANLSFQARLAGRQDQGWERHLAGALGLSALLGRYPDELSGGQQQRVAIGRALAGRPGLILADEPTGNLDETTGEAVLALMLGLVAEAGAALLIVTHSDRLAGRLERRLHLRGGRFA
ncbi:ABC transporter ATP-binding protein [Tabrizicola aquatica]|uniref:ABC transporter ATP-binding protein n=1 Tax=Tabrizicola aquatica TaxID=909926 RepID=UPI000CD21604|nr:ABC transporter ATP-binding protein [Tabrizicola aquatica]